RPVLVTVSRLLERKGHDVVLRALPRIAAAVPEVAYLVAGTGPREPVLRRLAGELGVAERVVFAGRVPDEELADYYGAADVFIHPNRELPNGDVEGFGIVFLEANAAGKPVIGGNSGGTPDAVVDGVTGFLIDPNDVDAVADAAIRLLTDRDLARKLGEQGRERARTEFTWERAVERLRALNRKVVAEYRHPGEHKQ
ncbi:MAG: glycosyltransferase, partial [Armatimonadetes bacterium]|nr:glycosyltransferase [Armatimonadota bacterium]